MTIGRTKSGVCEVRKRDGFLVLYNRSKIEIAVGKAFKACDNSCGIKPLNHSFDIKKVVDLVENRLDNLSDGTAITIEIIQDHVESSLKHLGFEEVAEIYHAYRKEREQKRKRGGALLYNFHDLFIQEAEESDIKRENANINGNTAMGTMFKIASEGSKCYYETAIINPLFAKLHQQGTIHIHDEDFYALTMTCCQIDLVKLLKNGFSTGNGYIREPGDIRTYTALCCIAIQSNQNDQHGGQSVPNFDYSMAEGVAKTFIKETARILDYMDYDASYVNGVKVSLKKIYEKHGSLLDRDDDIKAVLSEADSVFILRKARKYTEETTFQAMESLIHNLNTMHSRAGAQIPFSSLNYGTDTTPEGRLAVRMLLKATERGLGAGETPIFPIQIFKIKDGVSGEPEDPNYDLFLEACRVSAKRFFPNFSFLDAPFNAEYYVAGRPETEVAYMGCRTRVIANVYDKKRQTTYGRGNLSFTTINLPRLGIRAERGEIDFFIELDNTIDIVFGQLMERFKIQSKRKVKNFPFLMGQGIWLNSDKLDTEDTIGEVIKHGTLTVGFIGLAECLKAITGKHHGEDRESWELGYKIISHMRSRVDRKSKETGLNFSLIATPAEGLAGRFVAIDRKMYGSIAGITDFEYYTNSLHIPVHFAIDAFEKIELEAPFHALTNGGHITYVEMQGDPSKNLEAFIQLIAAMKKLGIGYGSINRQLDWCTVCGYQGVIDDVCPGCGRREYEGIEIAKLPAKIREKYRQN